MSGLPLAVRDLRHDLRAGETLLSLPALDLPPGSMTVLTGPSGSGKTTLLHLLAGLIVPAQGRITWGGTDLAGLRAPQRDRWRRLHSGFVFQDFQLIEELSPIDNVLVPVWFSAFSARGHHGAAQGLLDRFGVPARRRTGLLSRGEQQRVALARALLLSPEVIFADEPTASLDAVTGAEVCDHLQALARTEGRSIVVASHDPALIARADRRLELDRGHPVRIA